MYELLTEKVWELQHRNTPSGAIFVRRFSRENLRAVKTRFLLAKMGRLALFGGQWCGLHRI